MCNLEEQEIKSSGYQEVNARKVLISVRHILTHHQISHQTRRQQQCYHRQPQCLAEGEPSVDPVLLDLLAFEEVLPDEAKRSQESSGDLMKGRDILTGPQGVGT